jgi:Uma2 family endonuclease
MSLQNSKKSSPWPTPGVSGRRWRFVQAPQQRNDDGRIIWVTHFRVIPGILGNPKLQLPPGAEHIMSMPAPVHPPSRFWTEDEFLAMRDAAPPGVRYELVDGELLVSPSPTRSHQQIAARLFAILLPYVKAQRLGELLFAPFDVRLARVNIVQPDLLLIASNTPFVDRETEAIHLLLAVEVLSPGSARHDRVTKRVRFQEAQVPEYWVVDADSQTVERWRPADARPEILTDVLPWHPEGAAVPLEISLSHIFADWKGDNAD